MFGLFPVQPPPAKGWPPVSAWPGLFALTLRAGWELARARQVFARLAMPQIEQRNTAVNAATGAEPTLRQAHAIAWIAFVLPRMAARVPWRADCLVQALAGQAWLHRMGVGSRIVIGVEQPADGAFGAHAWLECGSLVVTGGAVDRYTVMLGQ